MKRNIDDLGRIVIPSEMRKQLEINNGGSLNIELVDNKIVITNPSEIDYKNVVEELEKWLKSDEVAILNTPTIEVVSKKIELLKNIKEEK